MATGAFAFVALLVLAVVSLGGAIVAAAVVSTRRRSDG